MPHGRQYFAVVAAILYGHLVGGVWGDQTGEDTSHLTAYEILLRLYDETHGPHWNVNTNWLQDASNVCSWYGITCYDADASDQRRVGHVQSLDLSDNHLTGSVPSEVFMLPYLETLSVRNNADLDMGLKGIAEAQFLKELELSSTNVKSLEGIEGAAASLETLHITNLGLGGTFPEEILKLTNLEGLFANYNGFQGELPSGIGALTRLEALYLFENNFFGQIPTQIGLLTKLKILSLGQNAFDGTIPQEINQLQDLETLSLQRAAGEEKGLGIGGPLPSLSGARDITEVYFQNQRLNGSIPDNFLLRAPVDEVVQADLSGNELTGAVPASLLDLRRLRLYLADNQIADRSAEICNANDWMGGDIADLGCDAFLCRPGFSASEGRQTETETCEACDEAQFWGSTRCAAAQGSHPTASEFSEREVLVRLYNRMGGRYWTNNDNWLNLAMDVCEWHGIDCDENGRVVEIDLKNNGLVNAPPQEIFSLSELRTLKLNANSIDFQFVGIANAGKLEILDISQTDLLSLEGLEELTSTRVRILSLSSNYLAQDIPEELFNVTTLQELDISHNRFTGEMTTSLGLLTNLRRFRCFGNRIAGQFPTEIGYLTQLVELSAAENQFNGTLPTELNLLVNLEFLSLHQTTTPAGIGGPLLPLPDLTQLTSLQLDANHLSGTLPVNLLRNTERGAERMEILLSDNAIGGTVPGEWANRFDQLMIDLTGNQIVEIDPALCDQDGWMDGNVGSFRCKAILCPGGTYNELGRQTGADNTCQTCSVKSSQLFGSKECGVDDVVTELDILNEFFDSTYGNMWTNNTGWTNSHDYCNDFFGINCNPNGEVEAIRLVLNGLTGTPSSSIFQLPSLTELNLHGNEIDFSFEGIGQAVNLDTLHLSETGLNSIQGLGEAQNLVVLHLTDNDLAGSIPQELFMLTNLQKLFMNFNQLSGRIPDDISKLSDLEELYLFHNRLRGQLPASIGSLSRIRVLILAENNFSGTLPPELNNLGLLEALSIQREGGTNSSVPDDVGVDQGPSDVSGPGLQGPLLAFDKLSNLRELYLGVNSLSGSIPFNFLDGIDDKTASIEVDLMSNRLTGELPASLSQFEQLAIFVAGNRITGIADGLCKRPGWMHGGVAVHDCDAILCPPNHFSALGRQADGDSACNPCPDQTNARFYGSYECLSDTEHQSLDERAILENFYKATDGDHWIIKTNWMDPDESICAWHGITCVSGNIDSVASIHLSRNFLEGTIPADIFQLMNLEEINFSNNDIHFNFDGIVNAQSLRYLNLDDTGLSSLAGIEAAQGLKLLHVSENNFGGVFPDEVASLNSLEALYMSKNTLGTELPQSLATLNRLVFLACSNCGLEGTLPAWIGSLANLEYLRLDTNAFTGSIPAEFSNLFHLKHLDLSNQLVSGGGLTGSLPAFEGSAQLVEVFLQWNEISGSIPEIFLENVNTDSLITVDLRWNLLTGGIPVELIRFEPLNIYLAGNALRSIPSDICSAEWNDNDQADPDCDAILCREGTFNALGRAVKSRGLSCVDCPNATQFLGQTECGGGIEKGILEDFFIDLNGPDWTEMDGWLVEDDVCTWFGVSCDVDGRVRSLSLRNNHMEGSIDSSIWELQALVDLDLRQNEVQLSFSGIENAWGLETLYLSETNVPSLSGIGGAPALKELHLTSNSMSGSLPDEIFELSMLEHLYLNYNNFDGSIPTLIGQLTSLKELYLFHNALTGSIPTEIGLLTGIEELSLGENELSGGLPLELGGLSNMVVLSLQREDGSGNELEGHSGPFSSGVGSGITGTLPFFFHMRKLRELYLGSNSITGTIPELFLVYADRSATITVDLTNNNIRGSIPTNLANFDDLRLFLAGNQIINVPDVVCNKSEWFDGTMALGCDALLCKPGTFNELGRRVSSGTPCEKCTLDDSIFTSEYWGRTSCDVVAPDSLDDKIILRRFFEETGGSEWTDSEHWESDDVSICQWYGVHCDSDDGDGSDTVSALILPSNNLQGTIPSFIFHLPSLRELNVGNNDVAITFGDVHIASNLEKIYLDSTNVNSLEGIGRAVRLSTLHIQGCRFGQTIPDELYSLASLSDLDVSNCGFFGTLSNRIGNLASLVSLRAEGNDLSGALPGSIGQLQSLETLDLSENNLYGTLPPSLNGMASLRSLLLNQYTYNGAGISGELLAFDQTTSLRSLQLASNSLTGSIPHNFLGRVSGRDHVDVMLRSNRLTGTLPSDLFRFTSLNIDVTDNLIERIGEGLCDETSWFDGAVGQFLCHAILCPRGTYNENGRQTSNDTPCEPCPGSDSLYMGMSTCSFVQREREKEILELFYQVTGGPDWKNNDGWLDDSVDICDWHGITCTDGKTVEYINLGSNNLVGTPPPELFQLPDLSRLWLYSNPIDFSFQGIGSAWNLESLLLDSTGLRSIEGIGEARSLVDVDVRFNGLEGRLPTELENLRDLESFSCTHNLLTGPLPDFASNYKLTSLRVGSNRFSGPLPSFASHARMVSLDVSGNEIRGPIPPDLLRTVDATKSVFLDLSSNMLTGVIPGDLQRFDDLTLYARDNRLDGIHPDLCSKEDWNDGDVGNFECDGILCPPGTYAPNSGRASRRGSQCLPCRQSEYFGTTECLVSSASRLRWGFASVFPFVFALLCLYII